MSSNDVKPFIFWIVCGGILLVELVVMAAVQPTVADGRHARDAYFVAGEFSKTFGTLVQRYDQRSKTTEALGNRPINEVIDPASDGSVKQVLDKYIVGNDWLKEINAERQNYQEIHRNIRALLHRSSARLADRVSQYHGRVDMVQLWYDEYSDAVARLLQGFIEAGILGALPAEQRAEKWLKGMEAKPLRDRFGFVTTDAVWPTAATHGLLTRRFRIVEALGGAIAGAEGEVLPDPRLRQVRTVTNAEGEEVEEAVVDVPVPGQDDRGLRKVFVEQMKVPDGPLEGSGRQGAQCWEVEISMSGTPAALLAALRELDELSQPIVVRLGVQWTQRHVGQAERQRVSHKDATCSLVTKVMVCDFTHFPPPAPAGGTN